MGNPAAEPENKEAGGTDPRLRKEGHRTAPQEPHQVDGVEDLHLPNGGAARIGQVTVVVVDGQRTQACGQHTRTKRVRSGPLGSDSSQHVLSETGRPRALMRPGCSHCWAF